MRGQDGNPDHWLVRLKVSAHSDRNSTALVRNQSATSDSGIGYAKW
jgi:hypothetical protein